MHLSVILSTAPAHTVSIASITTHSTDFILCLDVIFVVSDSTDLRGMEFALRMFVFIYMYFGVGGG